jgi:inorganic pyrophosphatase
LLAPCTLRTGGRLSGTFATIAPASLRPSAGVLSYDGLMTNAHIPSAQAGSAAVEPPELELDVVIEVPRGSFLKRGSIGRIDFVSPFPCPFNYGSVPNYLGLEGDLLDALVLGPRLPVGTRIRVKAWGAVTQTDRGMVDDKLVCCTHPPTPAQKAFVLRFFGFYAKCKGLLNLLRGRPGRNGCDGWCSAAQAMARARPRQQSWKGSAVKY